MLKKITLAAFLALGAAPLAGISALPAAAHDIRSVGVSKHGGFSLSNDRFRRDRRGARISRHGPRRWFLKRARAGAIVCFKKPSRRHAYGFDRRRHRTTRFHGRRLGYRAVRRLVRHGRRTAMRCFWRV